MNNRNDGSALRKVHFRNLFLDLILHLFIHYILFYLLLSLEEQPVREAAKRKYHNEVNGGSEEENIKEILKGFS